MNISISAKEYGAISFAIDQIESALETSENEEWNDLANAQLSNLYSVVSKYKRKRMEQDDFNTCKCYVRSRNGFMPPKQVNKLARQLMKKIKHSESDF